MPYGDILIHAGDFMTYGNVPREIIDFNAWLGPAASYAQDCHRRKS
jgi:hypothetical protein